MTLKLWTRSVWLYVMYALAAGILVALLANWSTWPAAQKIVAATYLLLPFHAWEEWRLPGGFAWQYNWVMGKSEQPDRHPMNQLTDMITVFGAMCFGLGQLVVGAGPAILMMTCFFAAAELGMHTMFGYRMLERFRSKGKRTPYNPGLATALLGFLPILVAGVWTLSGMTISGGDILMALGLVVIFSAITFLPERLIKTSDEDYAFDPGYYKKFL